MFAYDIDPKRRSPDPTRFGTGHPDPNRVESSEPSSPETGRARPANDVPSILPTHVPRHRPVRRLPT